MRRSCIAVAAYVVAAACCRQPAQALPQGLPSDARLAAPAPLLQPVRYYRSHRYYRHNDNGRQAAAADAAAIRPGQWEFAAQLEAAALPPLGSHLAPGAAPTAGGAMKSTYAICVAADNAVPSAFAPGCKIDALHRDGGRITWSMTCTNRQNAVHSDGVALYRGDTMEATMVSHLPNAKGGSKTDVAQHITGHYRGPCPAAGPAVAETEAPVIPPAAAEHATRQTEAWVAPPAAPAQATGPTAASPTPPAAPAQATGPTAASPTPPAAPAQATGPTAASPAPPAAPEQATGPTAASPTPPAAPEQVASPAVPETEASAVLPAAPEHATRHRPYRRHRRHYAYRRRWYGGGYSGFGPSPYSANGY